MGNFGFERFASSRVPHIGGNDGQGKDSTRHYGLGLALMEEITASHDGSVTIRPSIRGHGAVLEVNQPLETQERRT